MRGAREGSALSEERESVNLFPGVRVRRRKRFNLFPYLAQIDWLRDVGIKAGRDRSFPISQHGAGFHSNHG